MTALVLRRGSTSCEVAPAIGGALLSLTVGGTSVLRPAPSGSISVLDTACFPLVPFANRIDEGRFTFCGRDVLLPADPAALPHAHHGQGWRRSWVVDGADDDRVDLSMLHERGDWPWRYRAAQVIIVSDDGVSIALTVSNLDDCPMPGGLGLHPFFPRDTDTYLALDSNEQLLCDERSIPTTKASFLPGLYELAELEEIDNLLLGGEGSVAISRGAMTTHISADGAIGFHLYVPLGKSHFCVEPVTHEPNSFRAERSDDVIAPGEVKILEMTIKHTLDPSNA